METIAQETSCLWHDVQIISEIARFRMTQLSEQNNKALQLENIDFAESDNSPYGRIIKHLSPVERVVLACSLAPYFKPGALDSLNFKDEKANNILSAVGGLIDKDNLYHGLIPTVETALFLLAGENPEDRFKYLPLFDGDANLRKNTFITLHNHHPADPFTCSVIKPSEEVVHFIITGKTYRPSFSTTFPASILETRLDWEDLVLDDVTMDEVEEINAWIRHGEDVLYKHGLVKKVKKGYRALFYGPPGTGKTLTAAVLGKSNGLDVYRIDLSMVVSKYIGETEKNLAGVFDRAEKQNWILFFDEADALFGKRTSTKDAKDRYANQEISYLLQRIEDYPGVIILATNLKGNIDEAFYRRFQSFVYFPMPNAELRHELWKNTLPPHIPLEDSTELTQLAEEYEISGGAITNVVRYATLMAVKNDSSTISPGDLEQGVIKELRKEGKTL